MVAVIDLFSGRVVGWSMSASMAAQLGLYRRAPFLTLLPRRDVVVILFSRFE